MKIGILGGTFDPIHFGHLAIASAAKNQFSLDKVLFMPAFIPPHKASKRTLTPAPYRYRMVELAIRGNPAFEVSDIEFSRPEISYTVDTLRELEKKYPRAELYLIVGADSLAGFKSWKDPEVIAEKATLLVAPREAYDLSILIRDAKIPVRLLDMDKFTVTSTDLREQLIDHRDRFFIGQHLPESVKEYILKMNLYQKEETCS